jgi:hypothetical protein
MSTGDVIGKKGCVVSDARQERRTHGVCTSQAEEIEARPISHTSARWRGSPASLKMGSFIHPRSRRKPFGGKADMTQT